MWEDCQRRRSLSGRSKDNIKLFKNSSVKNNNNKPTNQNSEMFGHSWMQLIKLLLIVQKRQNNNLFAIFRKKWCDRCILN